MKPVKVFFASDQHFGAPTREKSLKRENIFLQWLTEIEPEVTHLFLLGDLFDFWFEYKTVVPKGFVRILGKLAALKDKGVAIYFFTGNHDLWMKDYLTTELGIPVYHKPHQFTLSGKTFWIGHGDGLGPGDKSYKLMKKLFRNPVAQWFFRWLHPDLGMRLGQYLSVENRLISGDEDVKFLGEDKEMLIRYCKYKEQQAHHDFYVFGHRHLPMEIALDNDAVYINTGDWISYYSYAVFDGDTMALKNFKPSEILRV